MPNNVDSYTDEPGYWTELGADRRPAEVRVRFTLANPTSARAFLVFTDEAAAWVGGPNKRFRAQIGGREAETVRLIPDPKGPFKSFVNGSLLQVGLRNVAAWPCEKRPLADCVHLMEASSGGMIVQLPAGFAKPGAISGVKPAEAKAAAPAAPPIVQKHTINANRQGIVEARTEPAAKPVEPPVSRPPAPPRILEPAAAPAAPKAKPLPAYSLEEPERRGPGRPRRVVDVLGGDPPPGRSALDQRRAGAA